MKENRLLALLAMLIGLVGGLLILVDALNHLRPLPSDLTDALESMIGVILGVAILAASLLIHRGKYSAGGLIDILLGIVAIILGLGSTGGILAIVGGVVGLVASESGTSRA